MQVLPFTTVYESDVVELIVGIQRGEFGIDIDAERQPDLRSIPSYYQTGAGNFWIALDHDRLVGTISLLDIGEQQGALRKMFVRPDFRGPEVGTARLLLRTLFEWAVDRRMREIFLGSTPLSQAAHRFYEKNGFSEIERTQLPASFPLMEVDTKFYYQRVTGRAADQ